MERTPENPAELARIKAQLEQCRQDISAGRIPPEIALLGAGFAMIDAANAARDRKCRTAELFTRFAADLFAYVNSSDRAESSDSPINPTALKDKPEAFDTVMGRIFKLN